MPRVLLLAMSGVRVVNARLREMGMTLPGFIDRGKVIASMPSLGLLTIAAHCPENWEVEYAEYDDLVPNTNGFDLVAISSLPARIYDAYRLADLLREQGVKVVIGGLHVSAMPEEAQLHADAIVAGEGEDVWKDVLNDWPNLKPLYRSKPARAFNWRLPRYDLLDLQLYNRIPLQTTRGCPLDCAFCGASRLISPYKRKALTCVEQELDAIVSRWPKPFIELADDNSFVHKAWAKELAKLMARYPVRWFTETDVSVADDPELLDLLAESGCAQLLIGFESPDSDSLKEADSKDWKRKRVDGYRSAIQKIQERGISVNGCFIHGFDHDAPNVFEATRDFVKDSGLSEVQVTILTPFPGTALFQRLSREGRLLEPTPWDKCTLFDVTFRPNSMTPTELENGFHWLVSELYSPKETLRRRNIMRHDYRQRRRHETSI